jgi:hypothetical protein
MRNRQDLVVPLYNTTCTIRLITNKLILLTLTFPVGNKVETKEDPRPFIPLYGEGEEVHLA